MNDTKELQVFKDVVLCGIACGLETPQEWLRNYSMNMMSLHRYEDIVEIECALHDVATDFYKTIHLDNETPTQKQVYEWMWDYGHHKESKLS